MQEGRDHEIILTEGAMVGRLVEHGRGPSRRRAQHAAARRLLSTLKALDADELLDYGVEMRAGPRRRSVKQQQSYYELEENSGGVMSHGGV